MDFSQGALAYARRLFEREKLAAEFICEDVFTLGKPDFDLVFNAGVLEHYTFEEQVGFLRGMASRSRKYVLALVPNRLCYWYWLWRIQKSAAGEWPYGKEVPLADLSSAFNAAGLHFVGQTFIGQTWTEGFITNLSGLDRATRDQILQIHRSPLISDSQKAYLVAALGSVSAESVTKSRSWNGKPMAENMQRAEMNAVVADALALRIGAEKQLRQLQTKVAEQEKTAQELNAQQAERQNDIRLLTEELAEKQQAAEKLAVQLAEGQNCVEALTKQMAEKDCIVQAQTSELAERQSGVELLTTQLTSKERELKREKPMTPGFESLWRRRTRSGRKYCYRDSRNMRPQLNYKRKS